MASPTVSFANVPLHAQQLNFEFSRGASPSLFLIKFPTSVAEFIDKKAPAGSTGDLRFSVPMEGVKGSKAQEDTIKNLVIVAFDGTGSPWEQDMLVADSRWWWNNLRFTGAFNITRGANDQGVVGEDSPKAREPKKGEQPSKAKGAKPRFNKAEFQAADKFARFGRKLYLPWTVEKDGKPITAKNVCLQVLRSMMIHGKPEARKVAALAFAAVKKAFDNQYYENDVHAKEEPAQQFLDEWLEKAEIGIDVGFDAKFRTYALIQDDDLDKIISPFPPTLEGGGIVERQDRTRMRASSVVVRFPQEQEIRLQNADPRVLDFGPQLPEYEIENVLRLPQDTQIGTELRRKGTWETVDNAMAAWDKDKSALTNNKFSKAKLDDAKVRQIYFPLGQLQRNYSMARTGLGWVVSAIWGPRIASLHAAYRTIWRINPKLMEHILSWKPERVTVLDPVTRTRAPAFVASDHAVIPNTRAPETMRRVNERAATNVSGFEVLMGNATGAPATINVLDKEQGVFQVVYDGEFAGRYGQTVVPSNVDNIPVYHLAGNTGNRHWARANLSEKFDIFVVLTVQFGSLLAPKDPRRPENQRSPQFYGVEVSATQAGWKGKVNERLEVEMMSNADSARFRFGDGQGAKAVNHQTLSSVAVAEARRYYFKFRDRIIGRFTVPGWNRAYRLFGSMRSLTLAMDAGGQISTTFDFTEPPEPRRIFHMLPDQMRREVFRELPTPKKK